MSDSIDVDAIAELIHQHQAALRLYAAHFSQWGGAWGDDCVQEAFMELAQKTTMPDSPKAWLYRAVRNRSLNRKRTEKRREQRETAALRDVLREAKTEPTADQNEQWIATSLKELEVDQREVVVLRIWSALGWQQIADLTQQSTSNAHRRYVAALNNLKQMWDQQHE